MSTLKEVIHTNIWEEVAEPDNPFIAKECYCAGYDVYGDLLGNISWVEYLLLLFKQERPSREQVNILENLAVAIANPGPRDYSIRAAMNAGVGGSTAASCLIAALAAGAGQLGGAHEVAICMQLWSKCDDDIESWKSCLKEPYTAEISKIWGAIEHPPGFNPHGTKSINSVCQTLSLLTHFSRNGTLLFLSKNRSELESVANCPLSICGVAAAAFIDLGLSPSQGEMLYLVLRLPGAAVHSLEQQKNGWRRYPFFADGLDLLDDPGPKSS